MSTIAKSAAIGLCLVLGTGAAAYAQSENIAALPPNASVGAPAAPVGPTGIPEVVRPTGASPGYVGPDPGKGFYPAEKQARTVEPSPGYVGPDPGKGFYPAEKQTRGVDPSPAYIGPAPTSDQGGD